MNFAPLLRDEGVIVANLSRRGRTASTPAPSEPRPGNSGTASPQTMGPIWSANSGESRVNSSRWVPSPRARHRRFPSRTEKLLTLSVGVLPSQFLGRNIADLEEPLGLKGQAGTHTDEPPDCLAGTPRWSANATVGRPPPTTLRRCRRPYARRARVSGWRLRSYSGRCARGCRPPPRSPGRRA